jgi:putative membrane protein
MRLQHNLLTGALAGFVATVPMTATMLLLHRCLRRRDRYALPPHQITGEIAKRSGAKEHVDTPEHVAASILSHFAYGAGTGALYGPLADNLPAPPALKGMAFGLAVWAISYLGWLPATGIMNMPVEQSGRRNALMIGAHVVWGAMLGLLTERWKEENDESENMEQ